MNPVRLILFWSLCLGFASLSAAGESDYASTIKPILKARCYACHAAIKQESNLRLDTVEFAKEGGDSGPAVVAEDPEASLLLERVSAADEFERMPPEGQPLTAEQIEAIRRWIESGAPAPADERPEVDPAEHWAFKPPHKPEVPTFADPGTLDLSHPIDAFLEQARRQQGLTRVAEVDRRLLLRRVYLDLIGVPPTAAEVEAFLNDSQPDAYERVVARLLESPQYGERWGRHWMDVWRYTDWFGLGAQLRYSQKHIWRWRDWIVESLNEDKGYDQMVLEMLAADETDPTNLDSLRATGFLARNYFLFNRTTWLDDTIEHTSKAFLGITMNCAKCHDHKYDPFTHQDYYAMRAFFEPHQVRLDAVPGETDLERDGLPRVFDAHLEVPTYLHIRGNAKEPDTSRAIEPNVPQVLQFGSLAVEPVDLPPEAHFPALRPYVLEDQLRQAEAAIETARKNLQQAQSRLQSAREHETKLAETSPEETPADEPDVDFAIQDDFTSLNEEVWERGAGIWEAKDGSLVQSQVGATRAYLRSRKQHPADFVARFRFTTTGGEQWKSVGLCFDVAGGREKMVYVSAHAGGPKLQISYNQGGGHVYPPGGRIAQPVALNEEHELVISVRGNLVNTSLDGGLTLAFQLPVEREAGQIDLVAFDAAALFHDLEVRPLSPDVKLVAPSKTPNDATPSVAEAEAAVVAAERAVEKARLYPAALRHSHRAARVEAGLPPTADDSKDTAQKDAVIREAVVATLEYQVAEAQFEAAEFARLAAADETKRDEFGKEREQALEKVERLQKAVEAARSADSLSKEQISYLTLRASLKALEGPAESDASRKARYPASSTGRRTALARWIIDSRNPLTARVAVNHIWMRHFGQPLVDPVTDFGRRTEAPPLQPLLDWLAVDFMERGWQMKSLHRLIVTSQAYRLSSSTRDADPDTLARDPQNHFFWRRPAQRMESQVIRDSMLRLAGTLDPTLGGPTIDPSKSDDVYRRSMYFTHSRDDQHPFLVMFDDADILACYRRSTSIVPQQALTLSNSKLALTMARTIADKLIESGSHTSDEAFARAAYQTILISEPTADELAACVAAMQQTRELLETRGHADPVRRTRQNLVHALLNHNDFITIR